MGGEVPSASTVSWNQAFGGIVGFPILIFFDLNFKNWPFGSLDIINLLAKAAIIMAIANGITNLRNR